MRNETRDYLSFIIFIIFVVFCFWFVWFSSKPAEKTCAITSVEHGDHGVYANWVIDGKPYSQLLDHKEYLPYLYEALEKDYAVEYNIFVVGDE